MSDKDRMGLVLFSMRVKEAKEIGREGVWPGNCFWLVVPNHDVR